jgi:hypothetical protein
MSKGKAKHKGLIADEELMKKFQQEAVFSADPQVVDELVRNRRRLIAPGILFSNEYLSSEAFRSLVRDKTNSSFKYFSLASNPALTVPSAHYLYGRLTRPKLVKKAVYGFHGSPYNEEYEIYALCALAWNANTPDDIIAKLASHQDDRVRMAAAESDLLDGKKKQRILKKALRTKGYGKVNLYLQALENPALERKLRDKAIYKIMTSRIGAKEHAEARFLRSNLAKLPELEPKSAHLIAISEQNGWD